MAQIQDVTIWKDGVSQVAKSIEVISVYDNLTTQAKFFYQLKDTNEIELSAGNLMITGQDYIDWGADADINHAAYVWVCSQLNLTLLP